MWSYFVFGKKIVTFEGGEERGEWEHLRIKKMLVVDVGERDDRKKGKLLTAVDGRICSR